MATFFTYSRKSLLLHHQTDYENNVISDFSIEHSTLILLHSFQIFFDLFCQFTSNLSWKFERNYELVFAHKWLYLIKKTNTQSQVLHVCLVRVLNYELLLTHITCLLDDRREHLLNFDTLKRILLPARALYPKTFLN